MKSTLSILFFSGILFFTNTKISAQKEYSFASSGQQKLILNPAFAGSAKGINVQSLYASSTSYDYYSVVQMYFGADYGFNNGFGAGLSFTKHNYFQKLYVSNQVDLTGAYKLKLKNNITLIPSLQVSFIQIDLDRTKLNTGEINPNPPYNNTSLKKGFIPQWEIVSAQNKQNVSFSSGFIMDINHKLTFGISVYDFNQPDVGLMSVSKRALTQIYHMSGVLFKDKTVSIQPYSVLKLQHYNEQYLEGGFYTSYKMLSVQTAVRPRFDYVVGSLSSLHSVFFGVISGVNFNYKKCKIGYTFKSLNNTFKNSAHELFFAARLGNPEKKIDRALFVD